MERRELLKDLGIDGKLLLNYAKERGFKLWTGFNWLMIGSSRGLL
jgi:hypothetical protein